MGSSVPSTVTDEDLDIHVRDLLIKEAKKRAEQYSQRGIRAYLASSISDSNAPKPNKRFLSSIIRSTDDHNKTILRAQALAAEEIKREKRERESRDKRARAEEAAAAERNRLRKRVGNSEGWDRWDGRTGSRKRKSRDWETWDGRDDSKDDDEDDRRRRRRHREHRTSRRDEGSKRSSRRHRSRSRSSSSSRAYSTDRHRNKEDDHHRRSSRRSERSSKRKSHKSRSRSPSPHSSERRHRHKRNRSNESSSRQRTRVSSPKPATVTADDEKTTAAAPSRRPTASPKLRLEDDEALVKPFNTSGKAALYSLNKGSSSSSTLTSGVEDMDMSRSPTPGPEPVPYVPSKMDKYFQESYDPRLDVAPLSVPQVPKTGLINNAEFEGWDAMLELLRQRREDKEEKRRLEQLGYNKDEIRQVLTTGALASLNSGGASIMNLQYKKRGAVREWDVGKEVL